MNYRGEIVGLSTCPAQTLSREVGNINEWLFCFLMQSDKVVTMPYIPYSRQDTSSNISPCAFRLVADIFDIFGVRDLITLDLHCALTDAYFSCLIHRPSFGKMFDFLRTYDVVAAPDGGGINRISGFVNNDNVLLLKHRPVSTIVLGELRGRSVLLVDDVLDSGYTIFSALLACIKCGASHVDCLVYTILGDMTIAKDLKKAGLRDFFTFDLNPHSIGAAVNILPIAQELEEMQGRLFENLRI